MNKGDEQSRFWGGFFLGSVVGAVTAYLLATDEGKKTARELIKALESEGDLDLDSEVINPPAEGSVEEKKPVLSKNKSLSRTLISKLDNTLTNLETLQKKSLSFTRSLHNRGFKRDGKKLSS